jgi:hypothetical protein
LWLGLGAAAFDLLLALIVTSLARRRLGYERWRNVHWLAYACWPIAVLHGLGTGSDTKAGWLELTTVACTVVVAAAVLARIGAARLRPERRAGAIALSLAVPVGIAGFALAGPLRSGWAAKAGTPASILRGSAAATGATAATAATAAKAATPAARARPHAFSDALRGELVDRSVPGGALVDIALAMRGPAPGVLRVRLAGRPLPGGGLTLVGSQVDVDAPSLGGVLAGRVTTLDGERFRAHVSQTDGASYDLSANLTMQSGSGAVTGHLAAVEQ